jgi:hypothetical protein
MSRNNNIASMYRKELDDLKENIIDSIKFIALENKLGRIKISKDDFPTNNSSGLEIKYGNIADKRVVREVVLIEKNEIKYLSPEFGVDKLITLLSVLEEKNYTILS